MGKFAHVPLAPVDPILGLTSAFRQDPRPHKVNLGVGIFKDEHLQTPLLSAVKKAEELIWQQEKNKEYLSIEGDPAYLEQMGRLVFGDAVWLREKERVVALQTPGGTGALYVGARFLAEEIKGVVSISAPTWPNHRGVFSQGGISIHEYPYYDRDRGQVAVDQMVQALSILPELSTVLLHACCHNPTGLDLSSSQWDQVLTVVEKRGLLPFFDMAYQGLGEGLREDTLAIEKFMKSGKEMMVAVSNAKNFSLYSERVGALFIVCGSSKEREHVLSRVRQMIRVCYSNPPSHGAKVVAKVLEDPGLRSLFEEELKGMRERLCQMRHLLVEALSPIYPCKQVREGKGMFGFLGLSVAQVKRIIEQEAIYMPSDGRINVCGLTPQNLPIVMSAIKKVL